MGLKLKLEVTHPDVHHYLIDTECVHTRGLVKVYCSLDAYNYFIRAKVWNIFSYNADGICIVYCTAGASQTLSETYSV